MFSSAKNFIKQHLVVCEIVIHLVCTQLYTQKQPSNLLLLGEDSYPVIAVQTTQKRN